MAQLTGTPALARRPATAAPRPARQWLAGLDDWPSVGILLLGLYYVALTLDMVTLRDGQIVSSYVDEGFIAILGLCFLPGLGRVHREVRRVLYLYGVYILLCVVSAGFNGLERYDANYPRWLAAGVGVALDAKIIVGMLGFAHLLGRLKSDVAIRGCLYILVGLALLNVPFVLRDILVGGESIYGEPLRLRSGFVQPHGFYTFVVESADISIIGTLAAAAIYLATRTGRWLLVWLGLAFMTLIHFSVKESVAVVVCTGIIAMTIPFRSRWMRLYVRIFFVGLAAIAAFPLMQVVLPVVTQRVGEYVGGDLSDTVRTYSYIVAGRIANDFFPFGSGAGTYASQPSRDFYFSPLYDIYGLSGMHGAARHFSGYLMDTFWPKILGEGGWFGLVAYVAMIGYIVKRAIGNLLLRADGMNVFCLCVLVTVLIKSFAASVMTQETFVVLIAFVIAYVLVHPVREAATARPVAAQRKVDRRRAAGA